MNNFCRNNTTINISGLDHEERVQRSEIIVLKSKIVIVAILHKHRSDDVYNRSNEVPHYVQNFLILDGAIIREEIDVPFTICTN